MEGTIALTPNGSGPPVAAHEPLKEVDTLIASPKTDCDLGRFTTLILLLA